MTASVRVPRIAWARPRSSTAPGSTRGWSGRSCRPCCALRSRYPRSSAARPPPTLGACEPPPWLVRSRTLYGNRSLPIASTGAPRSSCAACGTTGFGRSSITTPPSQDPGSMGAEASPPVAPSVFYCGRADRFKNLEGLLAAWPLVPTDRDLNLFGPGQLQRLASRQQRIVYGGCYQGDPPFRLGDVVVLPSFREGHANVLVEAFRVGAVVVGSAVPGVEKHLADHRGIPISRPLNARSIATAIASAVTLPADLRARL